MRPERPRPRPKAPLTRPARARRRQVLVVGIGNPGRGDDGLGPAAAERLEALRLAGVTCDANYQLSIEDALACSRHDLVVFVDAARGLRVPFTWKEVRPEAAVPALTHALGPGAVLAVCSALYSRTPRARLLAIRGHRWGVGEGLSPRAKENLGRAVRFLEGFLREPKAERKGDAP
ncbi:MAG TPA: hydrogenase maturation protease [Burkholderiales bacterium]|nr:hydrogenase maturation protease [Burkholderiales bacterium]